MNVLARPYMADHTRLTIMFIRDGLGAPGVETGVGGSLGRRRRTRIPSETKSSRRRGPGSADDQINPPGAATRILKLVGERFKEHMLHVPYCVLMNYKKR